MHSKKRLISKEKKQKTLSPKWKLEIERNESSAALILLVKKRHKRSPMVARQTLLGSLQKLQRPRRQIEVRLLLLAGPPIQ